jgi:simple sugar transport system ATP-binding protein
MRSVANRGLGVLAVSHDLPRMLNYADRVTILFRGRTVLEESAGALTVPDVVATMVGYDAEAAA